MNSAKVALSMPADVLRLVKKEVAAGRAKSLSAFVAEAVDEKLRRDELTSILDAMDAEHGAPTKAARSWAKRVLERPSSYDDERSGSRSGSRRSDRGALRTRRHVMSSTLRWP